MLQLQISSPSQLTVGVLELLDGDGAVSHITIHRGASVRPVGDVIVADVAREAANDIVARLRAIGVPRQGAVRIQPVDTWLSQEALDAERRTPGRSSDAVVWASIVQRAYDESELNWMYLCFMSLATILATIAIVLDSQILTIGAMVLGPEFGAVAALGIALVRRRIGLLVLSVRTLLVGFVVAIGITAVLVLAARGLGWVTLEDVTGQRPSTDFIYTPDKWSFIVALIAATAGLLSLTSARLGGLSGVFISVTTIPAAGNVALALPFGAGREIWGSSLQLLVNLTGMAVAGWITLAVQHAVWTRMARLRATDAPSRA